MIIPVFVRYAISALVVVTATGSLQPSPPASEALDDARASRASPRSPTAVAPVGPPSSGDTVLAVSDMERGMPRLGTNAFRATIRNTGDASVTAVLDLRAEPGMWMIPNMQAQFPVELAPGEERVVDASYEFRRLSREATLRARVGPGEAVGGGGYRLLGVEYDQTWDVGLESPEAYDPAADFVHLRRGSLELYAWRGSRVARNLDRITAERTAALEALEELLGAGAPERIRMVFYADEETKIEQTGHRGIGWATGSTIVEVRNDSIRLDPYHELAHIVAQKAGSPPAFLGEGFAIYATERLGADALRYLGNPGRTAHEVTCRARSEGRLLSLAELVAVDNIGSDESRAGLEYAEAGSFVRFLVESRGLDVFRTTYGTLAEGMGAEESLRLLSSVSGAGVEELEEEWLGAVEEACR